MDEDDPSPPPPSKPSQAPSWAMLGFVLGALFVLSLPRHKPEAPVPPKVQAPAPSRPAAPRLTTIEAVFAEWGKYGVWSHDLTEVALWNPETHDYADCFEVLRSGGAYYFRSIPHLTRSVLTHGVVPNSPLEFTETAEQRQEWLREKTQEDWRALGDSLNRNSTPP